jgi:hypothetical protein
LERAPETTELVDIPEEQVAVLEAKRQLLRIAGVHSGCGPVDNTATTREPAHLRLTFPQNGSIP